MSKAKNPDVMYPGPPGEDGSRATIRCRDGAVELGVIRPAHGRHMGPGTELVRLSPKEEGGYAAETLHRVPGGEKSGPAMVNSDDYKENWTRIFGSRPTIGIS